MRSLFWERKHEERLYEARSKIIESVKSAMKTRFIGMASKERSGVPLADNNFCYDCATGRHKRFFVDGVDGCDIEGEDKILLEADGFNKDCRVVRVINSWYKELELKRGDSVQVKADKIETLLNKVLKEMFLKRYHERGQLISQKYLTVSSTLAQFVFISPKSSIPPSDDWNYVLADTDFRRSSVILWSLFVCSVVAPSLKCNVSLLCFLFHLIFTLTLLFQDWYFITFLRD